MVKTGFFNALGTLVYIVLVATLMQNGDKIFGEVENSFIGPVSLLLLFTLSAVVVGGLVLGKPLMMYLDGKKKEAVSLFLATCAWIAGFTIVMIAIAVLIK